MLASLVYEWLLEKVPPGFEVFLCGTTFDVGNIDDIVRVRVPHDHASLNRSLLCGSCAFNIVFLTDTMLVYASTLNDDDELSSQIGNWSFVYSDPDCLDGMLSRMLSVVASLAGVTDAVTDADIRYI